MLTICTFSPIPQCNSGFGGDPQFYGASTITKSVTHGFNVVNSGACPAKEAVTTAEKCFESIASLGVNHTGVIVNHTVAIASMAAGCTITTLANGTAVATFNTAGTSPCAGSPTVSGQVTTEVGVTLAVSLTKTGTGTMTRSPKGEYCSLNKVGVLQTFMATKDDTNTTALTAALDACEAYCEKDATCTACSVDDRRSINGDICWVAIPNCGTETSWAGTIPGDVSMKGTVGVATITVAGPEMGWFGVGFNAKIMSDAPYTILVNSTSVWEQKIGTCGSEAEHCPGDQLAKSVTIVSNTVVGGRRTVVMTRPWVGLTKNHFTFSESTVTINFIAAVGWSQVFVQHKAHASTTVSLTNAPGVASCVCDLGTKGVLADNSGKEQSSFTKNCVAAPAGSLLEQQNPTCNSAQYAGGLSCCHHGRVMLDVEQATESMTQPTLRCEWLLLSGHLAWRHHCVCFLLLPC